MNAGGVVKRQGAGVYVDAHCSYDGSWAGDRMSGKGTYVAATGARYVGDFADDAYHGKGVYVWPDGARYEGGWAASRMHGRGEYVSADGVAWVGEFVNGMFFNGKAHVAVR